MPLVIPGMPGTGPRASSSSDSKEAWMNKLLGKKLTDGSSDETSFSKKDLPEDCRIIKHGSLATADHKPERLNIYLGEDGTVMKTD